jgi:prepilin-type N-terminal cleavage/methylation domain-containing protein
MQDKKAFSFVEIIIAISIIAILSVMAISYNQ